MTYVTNISVTISDDGNYETSRPAGTGWNVVVNKAGHAQDFNEGAKGKFVFVWYQSDSFGKGIAGLCFVTGEGASAPKGWNKINVDFNAGAGGEYIYLCYIEHEGFNYIKELAAGAGDTTETAVLGFLAGDVIVFQDCNAGAKGKYIYLGYRFNK